MTRISAADDRAQAGFTLAELLIAMALLGLLTAYAVDALRSMKGMERVTVELEAQAEVEATARHLRQTLADARSIFMPGDDGSRQLLFEGRADRLTFVTVLNDRLERGGLYVLTYEREHENGTLVLRRTAHRPMPGSEPVAEEVVELIDRVEDIRFQYCNALCTEESGDWLEAWPVADRLPELIRVSVRFATADRRRWTDLVTRVEGAF